LPLDLTVEDEHRNPMIYARNLAWLSDWHGFSMGGNFDEVPSYWLMEWMIPYWSMALPLTLLSAYLLWRAQNSSQR
jgi:hypothetical protein